MRRSICWPLTFEKTDPPAGIIILAFADGALVRLDVECIEAELRDIGDIGFLPRPAPATLWPTRRVSSAWRSEVSSRMRSPHRNPLPIAGREAGRRRQSLLPWGEGCERSRRMRVGVATKLTMESSA